jgi:hypothetical protein
MLRTVRNTLLIVASVLSGQSATAAPVASSPAAQGRAKLVRPLKLTAVRNIDWGTVTITGPLTDDAPVDMDINGTLRLCDWSANTVCSGPFQSARFNIQGTRGTQVRFIVRSSMLTNISSGGGETIEYRPSFYATRTLIHDGAPGIFVNVGGFIILTPTTTDGVYVGELDATVDYL